MLTDHARQADFPSLAGRAYLNTAAEGIPPQQVIDALREYAADKTLGMDGQALHEAKWRAAKDGVAQAFGLESDEVAICSSSSQAFILASLALRLGEGDEVVINDLDFPAGATPWLQPTCPATVKLWRSREGALRVEDLIPLLNRNTRLVTVSLVSFFNGHRIPMRRVTEVVRQHSSSLLAVDVTQALGRIPLDLEDVDLIVSSTHKWILASHGGGLVGVPRRHAEQLTVRAGGWFGLENAFAPDRFERAVTRSGAASFMVSMPNYPAIYAIEAGLAYIRDVGVAAIDEYSQPLVRACLDGLKRLPVDVITPDEPGALAGIVAFRHPEFSRLNRALHAGDIHVLEHAGRLRVSIHGYNTLQDVEQFLRTLEQALRRG